MLEKAARAACEIDGGRWDDPSYPAHVQEAIRQEYLSQAKAVLLAVREPDASTAAAGERAYWQVSARGGEPDQDSANSFTAMIDTIISTGEMS